MMRKKIALWVLALTIALMGVNACAIPVHFEDGARTIQVVALSTEAEASDEDAEDADTIDVQDFHLLSGEDDDLLIFADGAYYAADAADMPDVVEQVGAERINALPRPENLKDIRRGGKSSEAKALQDALIALGYLAGTADGQFGGKSQRAVSAFQKAMGLEETGEADALLQLLIASAQEETVNIVADYDPLMRYAPIAGKTEANLAVAADCGLTLDFDDVAGVGTLGNDSTIELESSGGTDLDSYAFEMEFVLLVKVGEDGNATVSPAVKLNCACVRRPIMQELLLKAGDFRCTVPITGLENTLDGVTIIESATAKLNADALKVLANAAEAGELKFRIGCKYNSFDGEVDADQLVAVSNIGKAGQAL